MKMHVFSSKANIRAHGAVTWRCWWWQGSRACVHTPEGTTAVIVFMLLLIICNLIPRGSVTVTDILEALLLKRQSKGAP